MAERYATIVKRDDGKEVISNISLFEGKPDDPKGDTKIIKIGDGPKIGMVKGGKGEAVQGWGFDIPVAEAADKQSKKASRKNSGDDAENDGNDGTLQSADGGSAQA